MFLTCISQMQKHGEDNGGILMLERIHYCIAESTKGGCKMFERGEDENERFPDMVVFYQPCGDRVGPGSARKFIFVPRSFYTSGEITMTTDEMREMVEYGGVSYVGLPCEPRVNYIPSFMLAIMRHSLVYNHHSNRLRGQCGGGEGSSHHI